MFARTVTNSTKSTVLIYPAMDSPYVPVQEPLQVQLQIAPDGQPATVMDIALVPQSINIFPLSFRQSSLNGSHPEAALTFWHSSKRYSNLSEIQGDDRCTAFGLLWTINSETLLNYLLPQVSKFRRLALNAQSVLKLPILLPLQPLSILASVISCMPR